MSSPPSADAVATAGAGTTAAASAATETSRLHDGSILRYMLARDLVRIPIWKGNRIIDGAHVDAIERSIGAHAERLDFAYRIVCCDEIDAGGRAVPTSYIIDGQHRIAVLRRLLERGAHTLEFYAVVLEKRVESELEIIDLFNTLNSTKPITWTDTNLVVNAYIAALEEAFNVGRRAMIRKSGTHRPYVSVDRLRETLTAFSDTLKTRTTKGDISAFVDRVRAWNATQLENAPARIMAQSKKSEGELIARAAELRFMLGCDLKLKWIGAALLL
jgi:hypothetical protein